MKSVLLLILVVLFAGCVDVGGAGPDMTDVSEESAAPQHGSVVLYTAAFLAAPGLPSVFDVEVPEGASDISYKLETLVSPGMVSGEARLSGCGSHSYSSDGGIWVANNVVWTGLLCGAASPGLQEFTVEAGVVPLSGVVTLRADVPL